MKKVLKAHKIPTSLFISAKSQDEALRKIKKLKFPMVIKPVDRAGSRGVFKLEGTKDLDRFFDISLNKSKRCEVVIEEFIDGVESTIDSITYKGKTHVLGISDKKKMYTPNIIARDIAFPPCYPRSMQDRVKKITQNALEALSVKFGASHTELIVTKKGPMVVEVAGRAGGALIPSDILPHLCGFDVIEKYIKLALGEDPRIPEYTLKNSVDLRFFRTSARGVLKRISGVRASKKMTGVSRLSFIVKKGDIMRPPKQDKERIGFVIVKGESRADTARVADEVERGIRFDIDDKKNGKI